MCSTRKTWVFCIFRPRTLLGHHEFVTCWWYMCRSAVSEKWFRGTQWTQHKYIYFSANFARISSKKIAKIHIFSGLFNLTVLGSNQFGTGSGIFKYLENRELNCMPSQKNRDRTEPNFGSVLSVLVLCISSELNFGNTRSVAIVPTPWPWYVSAATFSKIAWVAMSSGIGLRGLGTLYLLLSLNNEVCLYSWLARRDTP